MRGEDPAAIRILDLSKPTRESVAESGVAYIKTDVSDKNAVAQAFATSWPDSVQALPLTVFHTVAYINPSERKAAFLSPYIKVNIEGTRNMLDATKKAGADCFVATSSASVGLRPPSYFPWPWQAYPKDIYQYLPNADPKALDLPLEGYGACYAWTKAQAEQLVRGANTARFRTGVIRPGHGAFFIKHRSNRRGGSPTWLSNVISHFVNAQNVSIGHLAFEHALLQKDSRVGGNAYCVLDPNPPIIYGSLYKMLSNMAHPSTPINFPEIPQITVLLMAYVIEQYQLLRRKILPAVPALSADLTFLQPAVFNLSSPHIVYTDDRAQKEIGYKAPITTSEGLALAVLDWNEKAEAKVKATDASASDLQEEKVVPEPPMIR
ncbi:uncharacterized protein LTR77_009944 [Saxophila tyrrhenica]|uniref:3-beta hydroxysteroid dehydrogenase/isomerase domain-containing protein n=1 Tax=Saxophila tyrrhenica TaxID=1690608 RepID=A0AAV9P075_9PEZI|nr:hypothetical protein LTR77_009944 [Saxophila tyrrhenica]